jgi:hypothetical protein
MLAVSSPSFLFPPQSSLSLQSSLFLPQEVRWANDGEVSNLVERLSLRRKELRHATRQTAFGSAFFTYAAPTYFTKQIKSYASLYTADPTHLLNYPLDYHFHSRANGGVFNPDSPLQ